MSDCRICERALYNHKSGFHYCLPQGRYAEREDLKSNCPYFSEWPRRKGNTNEHL